ncbi:HrpJ domain-containing protein [Providencia sneebia]|uniref:Type III secreted effector protein n=1 Tax=Providencia sneebia DSM 19967 TaxID=1141660 RepID=K8WK35_9GAMM|nr:HrpJ domain-containing protein [Providencia sneebia]EKT60889.1 type III secreted effector protein [Providencia sneebia DSM 19967]
MAIMPLANHSRLLMNPQEKNRSSKISDDSEEVIRGQGVIDSTSEYASISMLAASHIRRSGAKKSHEEEWLQFSERILCENADETILNIENTLHQKFMASKELKIFLSQYFSDLSDLLMAIISLINRGKLRQEQLTQLKKLEEQLVQEDNDRNIQAGVNVALIAKIFSQKLQQSASHLRSLYREFLSYDGPVIYLYEQWVEEMTLSIRTNMMRYLSRALACDLQSLPFGHRYLNVFGSCFNSIGQLRELNALDQVFIHEILDTNLFQSFKANTKLEKKLSQLFISGIRGQENFDDKLLLFISSNLKTISADHQAYFLQLLIFAFSSIPINIYQSNKLRDDLICNLKELMDKFFQKNGINLGI